MDARRLKPLSTSHKVPKAERKDGRQGGRKEETKEGRKKERRKKERKKVSKLKTEGRRPILTSPLVLTL